MRFDAIRVAGPDRAEAGRVAVSAQRARPGGAAVGARAAFFGLAGVFIFILALQLLKTGAGGLKPILDAANADGATNLLGFAWLGSYGVLSGSPVAAISLSLFSGGTVSDVEAFAMLNGSRLGASFIVLFVGFLQYVWHRRSADGLFIARSAFQL